MWRIRISSSGCIEQARSGRHGVAEVPAQVRWRPEFDFSAKDYFQLEFDSGKAQESRSTGRLKLYKEVDITVRSQFSARG